MNRDKNELTIAAVEFIRAIITIEFIITNPMFLNTNTITTLELCPTACCVVLLFGTTLLITSIRTITVTVALPSFWNAVFTAAYKLVGCTRRCIYGESILQSTYDKFRCEIISVKKCPTENFSHWKFSMARLCLANRWNFTEMNLTQNIITEIYGTDINGKWWIKFNHGNFPQPNPGLKKVCTVPLVPVVSGRKVIWGENYFLHIPVYFRGDICDLFFFWYEEVKYILQPWPNPMDAQAYFIHLHIA